MVNQEVVNSSAAAVSTDHNDSAEEYDSDDLDGDLGDNQGQSRGVRSKERSNQTHVVEFDTNVFKVSMEGLQNTHSEIMTGDAQLCTRCDAAFNQNSRIVQEEGN